MGIPSLEFKECIFSISSKDVIRGMHYQSYPYGTAKLISCVKGSIIDVVVGIAKENYGQHESFEITAKNMKSLYIPDNYAHGFKALEDNTIVVYQCSELYYPENDQGIHYKSFGFDWQVAHPILSDKDKLLPPLNTILNTL